MMRKFTIPGEPKGKGRPRVTKFGTYTPKGTVDYQNWVKVSYMDSGHYGVVTEAKVPLGMELKVFMSIPQSASEKKKAQMRIGAIMPTKKPDNDNIIKAVCDSLNGIAYHDDAQICDMVVKKRFSDQPRVEVTIYDMQEG